jgi:hypothetical protein
MTIPLLEGKGIKEIVTYFPSLAQPLFLSWYTHFPPFFGSPSGPPLSKRLKCELVERTVDGG